MPDALTSSPRENEPHPALAVKPGANSTEFKIALLLVALEVLAGATGLVPPSWAATLSTLTGLAYKALRTWLKLRSMELNAAVLLAQLDQPAGVVQP